MAADRMRDEAERLVAAAIAAVSYATRGLGPATRSGFATGSAECCICPVCRAIAAMRDPAPELADKLAAGVGDLASGLASILRTLSQRGPEPVEEPAAEGDEFWESLRRKASDAAKAAARSSTVEDDPWRAATADEPTAPPPAATPSKPPMAKKAVAKKAVAKKAVAKKAVATKAVAKKAVAQKAPPRRTTRPRADGDA